MDKTEFFENLNQYICNYPVELRVDDSVYKERLDICLDCGELENGMCAKCGCYVELRALKKNTSCPFVPPKW